MEALRIILLIVSAVAAIFFLVNIIRNFNRWIGL